MASSPRSVEFKAVRVTVHSTQAFDTVIKSLYSEIGSPEQAAVFKKEDARDQDTFTEVIRKATGTAPGQDVTDRFMIFQARPMIFSLDRTCVLSTLLTSHRNSTTVAGYPCSALGVVASAKESSSETPLWPSRC